MGQTEKHFLFIERDNKRVPIAGPFESETALDAKIPELKIALNKRDPYTDFDTLIKGKTKDTKTIVAYTEWINKLKLLSNTQKEM